MQAYDNIEEIFLEYLGPKILIDIRRHSINYPSKIWKHNLYKPSELNIEIFGGYFCTNRFFDKLNLSYYLSILLYFKTYSQDCFK